MYPRYDLSWSIEPIFDSENFGFEQLLHDLCDRVVVIGTEIEDATDLVSVLRMRLDIASFIDATIAVAEWRS